MTKFGADIQVGVFAEERAEHRKIVQALKTKNSKALANALNSHILRASSALVEDLAEDLKDKRAPLPRKSSR